MLFDDSQSTLSLVLPCINRYKDRSLMGTPLRFSATEMKRPRVEMDAPATWDISSCVWP